MNTNTNTEAMRVAVRSINLFAALALEARKRALKWSVQGERDLEHGKLVEAAAYTFAASHLAVDLGLAMWVDDRPRSVGSSSVLSVASVVNPPALAA